jgi:hypothetical protein
VLLLMVVLSECWLSLLPVLVLPPPLLWLPLLSALLPLLLWLLLLPPPLTWLPLLPFSLLLPQLLGLELPLPLPLLLREFERFCSSPGDIDTCILLLLLDSEVWCLGLLLPLPDDLSFSPDDIRILAALPLLDRHL